MRKQAMIVMILTIVAKAIGFLRDISLSYFYGASELSDAYLISLTIPGVIFAFIGTGLSTCYIPIYNDILTKESKEKAVQFTNNLIYIVMLCCLIIVLLVFTFTREIVFLFASGFSESTIGHAILFTRIGVVSVFFSGLIYVFNSYLQTNNYFSSTVVAGIPASIFVVFATILSGEFDIVYLAIGNSLSFAIQFLFLVPYLKKSGFRWISYFSLNDKYIKQVLKLSVPVILGVSINQINILVDRTIASHIVIGGISALTYANKLNLFIQGIFVLSIASIFYPIISKMAAEQSINKIKHVLSESISIIMLLIIPVTLGSMIFSKEVVSFLFSRGEFDVTALQMTSSALFFYSLGMIGFGLREILVRVFYAVQDTKTPTINASLGLIVNIVLSFIFARFLGVGGLALATSIAAIITTGLLFINLRKKIGPFGIKELLVVSIKILIASLVMAVLARLSYITLLNIMSQVSALLLAISIGVGIYCVIISMMKIKDVDKLTRILKIKFLKGKNNN
ncbi:murein biosynthesis integral membrane protein MurJ [Paenibacillus sp. MMS20-IR301]|uniref:murein biosynthesis integral membrane protein MurJ n=1 Tax=Paenibacillus sp. MMS20-IR301 TaxID=2895946 RepID=UPI0028E7BCE0|nr:murein biosynthesis integral membrane protein MurJ [Paenibacillus sp. MMS20-IR301]WNS43532.1 murein biosynthesis integral membrane protein MurJ [Paenibacillus sp. MMS20-IR301]